jgi:hypothetical protein
MCEKEYTIDKEFKACEKCGLGCLYCYYDNNGLNYT